MSILQSIAKTVARTTGGKPTKGTGKGGSWPIGPGGIVPGLPGDLGDVVREGLNLYGSLPSLGGGGGGLMGAPPWDVVTQQMPGGLSFTGPVAGASVGTGKLGAAARGKTVAVTGAGIACPAGYHPAKDGSGRCVRNRRMNVCNMSAARRAIRRLKGARKALQRIERAMPRRTVRSSRRTGAHSH